MGEKDKARKGQKPFSSSTMFRSGSIGVLTDEPLKAHVFLPSCVPKPKYFSSVMQDKGHQSLQE